MKIKNPILRGFNPDPSICRVGNDYYIATSSFEWLPGVPIYHSRDLANWRLVSYALTRRSQIDLAGNPTSGGVWAPCLSCNNGVFYLIYSDVKSYSGAFKDVHNYLITAPQIAGPWSDPVYLNSSGFDPSMFHDDDGRHWLVNMLWDHRQFKKAKPGWVEPEFDAWSHKDIAGCFAGILLQEYSPELKKLTGPISKIYTGTELGLTEGPHLYKRNDYYYLLCAEGGTGCNHAVVMARSKTICGPYDNDPGNPILTSKYNTDATLQKAGHASILETSTGQWYMAHLCGRPAPGTKRCMLGRETSIQKCHWTDDGWLRVENGPCPSIEVQGFKSVDEKTVPIPDREEFNSPQLPLNLNSLRVFADSSWVSLSQRPGYVRLKGRESLSSLHNQSLIARRLTSPMCRAHTCVEFEPESFLQMAGLVLLYDTENYFYLRLSHDEQIGKCIALVTCENGDYTELVSDIAVAWTGSCSLRLSLDQCRAKFYYSQNGCTWNQIGQEYDASRLCDELCRNGHFTGTFAGICVQDLAGTFKHADFDYFELSEDLS